MTAHDDLIRRDTAERAIRALIDSPARGSDLHARGVVCGLVIAQESLAALPADPVAEAAVRFAGVIDRAQRQLVTGKPIRLYGLSGPEGEAALDAYRAAVAARAKETA